MPIKKCKYCKTRMNKVLWGMPSQDDYENADDFTEFRGCIITEPTETWRCGFCDSKIIPSHTPKSGLCLEEAPRQLANALQVFASRLNQIADLHYSTESIEQSRVATLECGGYENYNLPGLGYSFRDFVDDQTSISVNRHQRKGDFLSLSVCARMQLRFYFDGTGELVTHPAQSDSDFNQPSNYDQFDFLEFSSIQTEIEDLIAGKKLLIAVIGMILKTQGTCDAESCEHQEGGTWEELADYLKNLKSEYSCLYSQYPSASALPTLERQGI